MAAKHSRVFLCLVLLMSSVKSYGLLRIGLKGGLTFSTLSTDVSATLNSRTGWAAGVSLEIPLSKFFYLQPEALYIQKGFSAPPGTTVFGLAAGDNLRIEYINVPILLKFILPFPFIIRPYAFVGPDFGFKTSTKLGTGGTVAGVRDRDFMIDMGAGIEFKIAPLVHFLVSARYQLGLVDINEGGLSWKTRTLLLMAGFNMGL